MAPAVLLPICRYLASGSATRQLFPEVRRRRLPLRHLHRVSSSRVCHHAASSDSAESRGPDILTNCIQPMGCCGSSTVDAEEHLDYSAGKVTIIPDLKSWERKLDEASELGQTVVVKFSATWCGPCRNAAPVFAELSLKHSDLVFVSVDVDDLPELVTQFDVRATPTFVFMRDKQEIDKLVGGNQEDLIKKFDPYCQQN